MRRYHLVPLLAVALAVTACSSPAQTSPRTVTTIVVQTGTSPASTGSTGATGSAGITVVGPSGSTGTGTTGTGGSGTQSTAPSTPGAGTGSSKPAQTSTSTSTRSTRTSTTKTAPTSRDVRVNPLQVSCAALLDSHDIKKALGASVSSATSRIVDVANPDVKMTGKIKCYFGAKSTSKSKPVIVALARYSSVPAAQSQMNVTVQSEVSLGADSSTVRVSGKTAHVLLRDGGLVVMRYDNWTLSIAVQNKLTSNAKLPAGLQQLATMVLARVIKNA